MPAHSFYLSGIPAADALLATDANAVLLGMVLNRHIAKPWSRSISGG